jgi:hypothetical protein
MHEYKSAHLLAYVTGLVNQKLLLRNEYLAAENRILRSRFPAHMRLSDPERSTLADIGKRLGRSGLQQVASIAKPEAATNAGVQLPGELIGEARAPYKRSYQQFRVRRDPCTRGSIKSMGRGLPGRDRFRRSAGAVSLPAATWKTECVSLSNVTGLSLTPECELIKSPGQSF